MTAAELPNRTRLRVNNLKRLVEAFAGREMIRSEIAEVLSLSASGARKYVRELADAGVIIIARHIDITTQCYGIPVFALNPDSEKVAGYLAHIEKFPFKGNRACGARTNLQLAMVDPTRHFHIMGDDTSKPPVLSRAKPARRDDLVAALFGGAAQTEPASEIDTDGPPPRQTARICFPDPAACRFDLEVA